MSCALSEKQVQGWQRQCIFRLKCCDTSKWRFPVDSKFKWEGIYTFIRWEVFLTALLRSVPSDDHQLTALHQIHHADLESQMRVMTISGVGGVNCGSAFSKVKKEVVWKKCGSGMRHHTPSSKIQLFSLIHRTDTAQDARWKPGTTENGKLYIYTVFFPVHTYPW